MEALEAKSSIPVTKQESALGEIVITAEQVDIIKNTLAKGATDDELKLFFFECKRRGVHPLDRLIHFVARGNGEKRRITFQTSIDLFRSQAEDTGEYRGQEDIEYGPMLELNGFSKPVPEWAKATVKRYDPITNEVHAESATAYWDEYYPGDDLGWNWKKMPRLMLGKCAEALALRKAFPRKLAGLYTFEEMVLGDLVSQGKTKTAIKEPQKKAAPGNGDQQPTIKDPTKPVSEGQLKAIHAMLGKLGVKDADKHTYCANLWAMPITIESLMHLSMGDASFVIEKLNEKLKGPEGNQLV